MAIDLASIGGAFLSGFFRAKATRQPDAGAMSYAVDPHFNLPGQDLLGYAQYRTRIGIMALQPPMLWAQIAVPVAGVGGLVHGTIYGQQLFGETNSTNPV